MARPARVGWKHGFQAAWLRLLRSRDPLLPGLFIGAFLVLTIVVHFAVLQGHPTSGDEYAYLVSAQIFARGRLSVPSPRPAEFFGVVHVINDGRFYGKYPPGWPGLLSVGVLLGAPWIVNPLLGALALGALYQLAARHFSRSTANACLVLLFANPFLLFNSASYFSHPAGLLFAILFLHHLLEGLSDPNRRRLPFAAAGLWAGIAFAVRPYTTVALLGPMALWLGARAARACGIRALLPGLLAAAGTFSVCLAVFLLYNWAQTGDPLLQPFQIYALGDKPSLPRDAADWLARVESHGARRVWALCKWLPFSPLFLAAALFARRSRTDARIQAILLGFASLLGAYFFYWGPGIVQYGPRYLYEAAGFVAILMAVLIRPLGRRGWVVAMALVVANVTGLAIASDQVSREIRKKQDVFLRAEDLGLSDAVVFVGTRSGPAPARDCIRNGIDFDGPVLFVRDLGRRNHLLLEAFPGRKAYYYSFDPVRARGRIVPYDPGRIGP